jgi:type IX secretion system PorP/SprF family membrane protein
MKNPIKYLICILTISFQVNLETVAQQAPLGNQYLINDFSLSPAYAGAGSHIETLLSYRKDWVGVSGSPESRMININGALPKILNFLPKLPGNMGIGATLLSEQAGIFRNTSFSLSYAYEIKIAAVQSVRLGLSVGILENNMDLTDLITNSQTDPAILGTQDIRKAVFDASFGALYRFQNLDVGFALPQLMESSIKDDNSTSLYSLSRHYLIHASYLYAINKDFQLKPFLIARTTANSEFMYEVAALVKYQKQWMLGLTYRKSNLGLSMGGEFYDIIIMNYTYEFSGQGMLSKSSGTHEISLGFALGKKKDKAPAPSGKKPYYDWIDK